MIQAVFLDVDGTLLRSDHEISPKNLSVIQLIQEQHNVAVFLATGRPPQDLKKYYDQLRLDTPAICMNGAYIINFSKSKLIKEQTISLDLVKEFKKECQRHPVELAFYQDSRWMTTEFSPAVEKEASDLNNSFDVRPFKEIVYRWKNKNEAPHKMGVLSNDEKKLLNAYKTLKEKFQNVLSVQKSQSNFIEVTAPNVSKGKAIAFLLEAFPFQREKTLAIGDSDNDISMLEWAGVGVAMGNAREHIKRLANDVTLTNLEDGVAHALEKHIIHQDKSSSIPTP
ncbi:MAG: Cof-type HAD-IIB family hydrolase [Flavobacteriales bacterium Tduv]